MLSAKDISVPLAWCIPLQYNRGPSLLSTVSTCFVWICSQEPYVVGRHGYISANLCWSHSAVSHQCVCTLPSQTRGAIMPTHIQPVIIENTVRFSGLGFRSRWCRELLQCHKVLSKTSYAAFVKASVLSKRCPYLHGSRIFSSSWMSPKTSWGYLPMIFTCDFVIRDNHWQVASFVTPKSLFTVTHALLYIYHETDL